LYRFLQSNQTIQEIHGLQQEKARTQTQAKKKNSKNTHNQGKKPMIVILLRSIDRLSNRAFVKPSYGYNKAFNYLICWFDEKSIV
jgi:hypothetical protein